MDNALDVEGLPEVVYTSEGNVFLHLPGVIVAESSTGETHYLLGDGLGSIRQATDDTGAVVAYNEYDPYGTPITTGSEPYGFTGEWWQAEVGLLHLRARWYLAEAGTFLSRDPVESEPPYQYVRGNPVNLTDPTGFYTWYNRTGRNFSWQHRVVENWFERQFGGFWKTHHEFNQIMPGYGRERPDILHFPRLVPPQLCGPSSSPIDFSQVRGWPGEIYEIEPIRLYPFGGGGPHKTLEDGLKDIAENYLLLNSAAWAGWLQDTFKQPSDAEGVPHTFMGKTWNLNTVSWRPGGTVPLNQIYPISTSGQPILVISPFPGLILYADNVTRNQVEVAWGVTLSAALLQQLVQGLKDIPAHGGSLQPKPSLTPGSGPLVIPQFLIDPTHPYNPINPYNCLEHPELCTQQVS